MIMYIQVYNKAFFFSPINKPLHTKRLPQRAASRKKTLKEKNGKKQNEWSL